MAISDCEKCWETPCECGHGYRFWSTNRLEAQIKMLQKVLEQKREEKDADIKSPPPP